MKVTLLGSPTLNRFTEGILRNGLERCGCEVSLNDLPANFGIVQIHGAPAAREYDLEIINNLLNLVARFAGCIILFHRPDEIKEAIPHLNAILSDLPSTTGLVMLGDLLIDDPFYQFPHLSRRVIPHGFFDIDTEVPSKVVLVGSHTTWGEMRSIKRTLMLLKAILAAAPQRPVVGYLGGIPSEELSREALANLLEELKISNQFILRDFNPVNWREECNLVEGGTIFFNQGAAAPKFDLTFNVQLYHYGSRIRLGESSGSLHASAGIPVVFEMNGSEKIENLKVVKVPYRNVDDADSADFTLAAKEIVSLIDSGEYQDLLSHNRKMVYVWDNRKVAKLYLDFMEVLAATIGSPGSLRV